MSYVLSNNFLKSLAPQCSGLVWGEIFPRPLKIEFYCDVSLTALSHFFVLTVCNNICSQSKKSLSRGLVLLTMHITCGDRTKHTQIKVNRNGILHVTLYRTKRGQESYHIQFSFSPSSYLFSLTRLSLKQRPNELKSYLNKREVARVHNIS